MPRQVDGEPYFRISVDEAADLHGNDDYAPARAVREYKDS